MPSNNAGETTRILDLMRRGDERLARDRLIEHVCERLRRLTRQMLRRYPGVHRWEETDDVLQNALQRLYRAVAAETPESSRHLWGLAALQIRRELIDLARHHLGPDGHGARHYSDRARPAGGSGGQLGSQVSERGEPDSLEAWTEFHEAIDTLPHDERELVGLIWYEGLTQEDAADVLDVSLRTVKRRWQSARVLLAAALGHGSPK